MADINTRKTSGSILVVGGANMDILGAPKAALTLHDSNIGSVTMRPGGVALNIARALNFGGEHVRFCSVFGDDLFAKALKAQLEGEGLNIAPSFTLDVQSSVYLSVHDETGDMHVAINQMRAMDFFTVERAQKLIDCMGDCALIVADTNLPEETLLFLAKHSGASILVDPVSNEKAMRVKKALPYIHALKPNRLEAAALTGIDCSSDEGIIKAAGELLKSGLANVIISLGKDGVYYANAQGGAFIRPSERVHDAAMHTGAGDAMMAGIAMAHKRGEDIREMALCGMRESAKHLSDCT